MLHTRFQDHRTSGSRKKILEGPGFCHIRGWQPSWSCDPDAANKLSFPLHKEDPHKIWL